MSKTAIPKETPVGTTVSSGKTETGNQSPSAEHEELFRALDRLLSIGSYYTPDHARYQEVAREAHAAIRANLAGAPALEIECVTGGFYVHDVFIEGNRRNTERIYELMDVLNIALLRIQADATSKDLHEAVATLKQHQITFAGVQDYEEIEITGLPDTVSTTSQKLYVRTKDRTAGPGGTRPRAASADHYVIPEANLVPTPEGQKLEREFLGIISSIMRSGDPTRLKELDSDDARNKLLENWVPDSSVHAIKEIMEALKRTNSDPMIMEHLIGHAQAALELTGDPELVDLVFQRLRKETGIKSDKPKPLLSNRPKPKNPRKHAVKYTMSPEQMNGIIAELTEASAKSGDLVSPSAADCLGICTQVLCRAPTEHLAQGIGTTIFRILSRDTLGELELEIAVPCLVTILKTGSRDAVDMAIPMFFSPLRKFHPRKLGPLWLGIWKSLVEIDHKRLVWPHLVNELLMGVEWEDPTQKLALFESLSRVRVGDGQEMLERLEELQALRDKRIAPDLFHAPAPLLYPVHIVLLGSTMSREHGPKLHARLEHQRANRLVNLLVEIMGGYKQSNKLIYQAILEQGVSEKIIPKLCDLGSRLLKTAVMNLHPDQRDEVWVSEAVAWLGRLDPKRAKPTLNRILNEKKYLFLPVWPSECREAARQALADRNEHETTDEREARGDEIQ